MNFQTILLAALCLVVGSGCRFYPPTPEPNRPSIILYKENDARGRIICVIDPPRRRSTGDQQDIGTIDFTRSSTCPNDDVRSLVLKQIQAGVRIWIYDDSSCTTRDSATRIVVKRYIARKVIGSFERGFSDADVSVTVLRGGNLDGKVSCMATAWF